jgi:hypothetical protein
MQSPEHWPSEITEVLQHAEAEVDVVGPYGLYPLPAALVEQPPGCTPAWTLSFSLVDMWISQTRFIFVLPRLVLHDHCGGLSLFPGR